MISTTNLGKVIATSDTSESNAKRDLYLTKDISQESLDDVVKRINEINDFDKYQEELFKIHKQKYKRQPIKIHLSSYGGSVYCGLGLIGTIKSSKTPVHVIASGKVMSMGFLITIAAHKSYARPYTTFMYHALSSMSSGQLGDLIDHVDECNRLQIILDKIVTDNTNIPQKRLKKCQEKKFDWFMDTDTALELGVIKKVV